MTAVAMLLGPQEGARGSTGSSFILGTLRVWSTNSFSFHPQLSFPLPASTQTGGLQSLRGPKGSNTTEHACTEHVINNVLSPRKYDLCKMTMT